MSKLGKFLAAAILMGSAAATPSAAENVKVRSCKDAGITIRQLAVQANGKGIRSFYSGAVQVMLIDQIEPAAMAFGLVILANDPQSEIGDRNCFAVTNFSYLDLDAAKSSYDPAKGVTLVVPAMDYDGSRSVPGKPLKLLLKPKSATGQVTAER